METALHQYAGAAHLECLGNLLVNGFEVENVTFGGQFAFEGPVKGTKAAVLGAKICIVDVAVNDVGHHALGMQLAPKRIGFHAQANEVIRSEIIESLRPGNRHIRILRVWQPTIQCYSARGPAPSRSAKTAVCKPIAPYHNQLGFLRAGTSYLQIDVLPYIAVSNAGQSIPGSAGVLFSRYPSP